MSDQIHHVPGRLRVRSPALKNNIEQIQSIEQSLAGINGIKALHLNTLTGSIVVNYDVRCIDGVHILSRLKEHRHVASHLEVSTSPSVTIGWSWVDVAINAGQVLGKVALETALEKAFECSATSLVAAIF